MIRKVVSSWLHDVPVRALGLWIQPEGHSRGASQKTIPERTYFLCVPKTHHLEMIRHRKPPSPTWRSLLKNHVGNLVSIDFFVVPTVKFKLLFVLICLAHERRQVVHFNVTEHPSEDWTARQVLEAFPWEEAPRYMLRDRDSIYGSFFCGRVRNMGIKEVVIAPRSPWQSPYVERVIGSIRRECLDHVLVLDERHLKKTLTRYFDYYHEFRTHRSLNMDCPVSRLVQGPRLGKVISFPEVGGLHHHYERRAA